MRVLPLAHPDHLGKADGKDRPPAGAALHRTTPSMCLGDPPRDCEPEPGAGPAPSAGAGSVDPIEPVEDVRQVAQRYPDPVIANNERGRVALIQQRQTDLVRRRSNVKR